MHAKSSNKSKTTTSSHQWNSLSIRGGGDTIVTATTNDNVILFSPKVLFFGSIFSFLCLLYGAACAIDPCGMAQLLYGHEKQKRPIQSRRNKATPQDSDDSLAIEFLMHSIGSVVSGLGLMAAFSISSDIKHSVTKSSSLYLPAIGIGLIPCSPCPSVVLHYLQGLT